MGGTSCKTTANSSKTITIAILGLDNAGKTTTVRVLEKVPTDSVAPTVGFSQSEITHKNEKIKLIDLGGVKTFRDSWRHYYDDAYGFVYVLDSSEESRLSENRAVLQKLLQEEKVRGKPILILANKQDKPEALDKNAILEDIKLEKLVNENQTLCRVELCTAKSLSRNGKNNKMDESIRHGFDWLIKTVYENYEKLHARVEHDTQKRNEAEKLVRRERQERIQKLREERDKQEGNENQDDENDDTIKNGFVSIHEAVKNAERNAPHKTDKDKSSYRVSSSDKKKSKSSNENATLPPIPAPRSASLSRELTNDESNAEKERPRCPSTDSSSRINPTHSDDNEQTISTDEQTKSRPIPGKKKKVIGAGRQRLNGDNLPPIAPSASASRRDDLAQPKGPPAGTPRPQPLVATWAITSPSTQTTAEQLTAIRSGDELEDDDSYEENKNTSKSSKHAISHSIKTNGITHNRKNRTRNENNKTGDDEEDDDEHDDSQYNRKSREKESDSQQRHRSSSTHKTQRADSGQRSHSRNSEIIDDNVR